MVLAWGKYKGLIGMMERSIVLGLFSHSYASASLARGLGGPRYSTRAMSAMKKKPEERRKKPKLRAMRSPGKFNPGPFRGFSI
jgi:hypothetical protein